MAEDPQAEATLDPDDWEAYRAVAHRMLDELLDHVRTVRARPVWRAVPAAVKVRLDAPPPDDPRPIAAVWEELRTQVLPYGTGNLHPRFFGWVHGAGTVGGMLADLAAAGINANLGGREHAPVYVERQVLAWCRQLFGWPETASGVLVTGTSLATVIALAVARNAGLGDDVRRRGLTGSGVRPVVYASTEAHVSTRKALELLGLGADALHPVPVDAVFRLDVDALRAAIARDRAEGRRPLCVVGTAGTVNTGAVDDLAALAALCRAEGLWFHVDGAFGALAVLSPTRRALLAGIEQADSLAFDFHKWLHAPYAVGCVLVRDGERHRAAFTADQSYLAAEPRGLAAGAPWFTDFGPDLSRGFSALRVWVTVQEHGLARLGAMIDKNCDQARHLAALVADEPRLELCAPVTLNVVCFRYVRPGLDAATLDRLNHEIIVELHERGLAAPSATRLGGVAVIRAAILNHRTQRRDLEALVAAVCAEGDRLVAADPMNPASSPTPPPDQRA